MVALLFVELALLGFLEILSMGFGEAYLQYRIDLENYERLTALAEIATERRQRTEERLAEEKERLRSYYTHIEDRTSRAAQVENLVELAEAVVDDAISHALVEIEAPYHGRWHVIQNKTKKGDGEQ